MTARSLIAARSSRPISATRCCAPRWWASIRPIAVWASANDRTAGAADPQHLCRPLRGRGRGVYALPHRRHSLRCSVRCCNGAGYGDQADHRRRGECCGRDRGGVCCARERRDIVNRYWAAAFCNGAVADIGGRLCAKRTGHPGLARINGGAVVERAGAGAQKTPGGKLKLIEAFPPGAISRPAARRESQWILRRRKLKCQ